MVSKKRDGPGKVLMALARGDVQRKAGELVSDLLRCLLEDPLLPADSTLVSLFATLGQLLIRFLQYQQYPTKLWELCKTLNTGGWADACLQFLSVPAEQLDVGYSRALQREALLCGSEADAVSYLMSSAVQDELAGIFQFGQSTSLDAERKFAQDKKNEKARLSTLA